MKRLITSSLIVALSLTSAVFATDYKTIKSGYWSDGTVWDLGTPPGTQDTARMRLNYTLTIDSAETIYNLRIGSSNTGTFQFNIVDGADLFVHANALGNQGLMRTAYNDGTSTASNTLVTMSGGQLTIGRGLTYSGILYVAQAMTGATTNVTCSYTQTGGATYINGYMSIAGKQGTSTGTATGLYTMNGGSLYLHNSVSTTSSADPNIGKYVGWNCGIEYVRTGCTGTFSWLSGTLSANYLRAGLDNNGSGVLSFDSVVYNTDASNSYADYSRVTSVNGIGRTALSDFGLSGGSLIAIVSGNVVYNQGANASMVIDIAGTGEGQYDQLRWVSGTTTSATAQGTVNLADGTTIVVNVADGTVLQAGDTFYIVLAGTAINADISTIVLSGVDAGNFELALTTTDLTTNSYGDAIAGTTMYTGVDSITVQALTLTYVPEPAIAGLLAGAAALTLAVRRRRTR